MQRRMRFRRQKPQVSRREKRRRRHLSYKGPEVVREYAIGKSLRAGNGRRALSYKSSFRRKSGDEK
jgi:hypothetical protein